MKDHCELYRHFNGHNELLYVGISLNAVARLCQHRQKSDWFEQISRIEVQTFLSRAEAIEAEQRAILEEKPRYNKAHSTSFSKYVRESHEDIRQSVDPAKIYTFDECAKILGIKKSRLEEVWRADGIGYVFAKYYPAMNISVVEFKGQHIIDFLEVKMARTKPGTFRKCI